MSPFESLLFNHFAVFTLVLGRVGGLVVTAPIFGTQAAPMQARALITVIIALLMSPLLSMSPPPDMTNLLVYSKYLANEVLVGVLLGFGVTLLLSGIQVTGQIVTQLSGTALADVFDPNVDENVSVIAQFFYFLTLTIFALLGGHRMVMDALLDTYQWLPPGAATLGDSYVDVLTSLLRESFALGLQAAAPAMLALLLATLVLGLVGRTLPQLNVLAVGFSVNAMLSLGCLLVTLGGVAYAFPQQAAAAINSIRSALHDTIATG